MPPATAPTVCTAPSCGQPSPTGFLCPDCTARLDTDLEHADWLCAQLRFTETRQGNTAKDRLRGSSGDGQPLPWVPQAADAAEDLDQAVHDLAVVIAPSTSTGDVRPLLDPMAYHGMTPALLEWMRTELDAFGRTPGIGEWLGKLDSAVDRGMGVIDHPADRIFLGRCGHWSVIDGRRQRCTAELSAEESAERTTCYRCGAEYDVADRHDEMMWKAREHCTHAGRLAGLLTLMGIPVAASTIRGYAHQGKLTQRGTDRLGRPQYRIRDVMTLRLESLRRSRERAAASLPG